MTTQLSMKKAREMSNAIKSSLSDLEENLKFFHACQGHLVLGYDSFTEWWDSEVGHIPISMGLRNWVIRTMVDEYELAPSGRVANGVYAEVADAVGTVSPITVRNIIHKERERNKNKMTGRKDDDPVTISVIVPNLWRRHIIKFAVDHNLNMADVVRPLIKEGMKRKHGVDLSEPIIATGRRSATRK